MDEAGHPPGGKHSRAAFRASPEYSRDKQVRCADPDAFDRAIRNTYKVLLTRGMRDTLVYSTDAETQDLLTQLFNRIGMRASPLSRP